MGQRNMNEEWQGYRYPEPCICFGGSTIFTQPNMSTMARASGSTNNHDVHNIPEHYEGTMFYERMQYNGFQDPHPALNLELGVAIGSNFCNSYLTPASGSGMVPIPLNQGSVNQSPSSSNSGVVGVSSDEYHFVGEIEEGKRKNAEGIPGTFQYYNPSAGPNSSDSVVPLYPLHVDVIAMMDASSFPPPQYRDNDTSSVKETRSQRSLGNSLGASGINPVQGHTHNPLIHGIYVAQTSKPASTHWSDQHSRSNCSNRSAWTHNMTVPYMHGSSNHVGFIDSGNLGTHSYHETAGNGSSTSILNPPVTNSHHPTQHMQAVRGHDINFYPQVAAVPFHVPTNNVSHNILSTSQDGCETKQWHLGTVLPTGFSIYRPHQEGRMHESIMRYPDLPERMHESIMRYPDLPHLRVIPTDEVAILDGPEFHEARRDVRLAIEDMSDEFSIYMQELEIQDGHEFHEAETFVDHHRDMRLDIQDMAYEELLALGEQIGNVNTGLTEEIIVNQLKTRCYSLTACEEEEPDSCIICQDDYRNQETIGTLTCGHEYHADCLKTWLLVKNVCPACKSEAITTETKDA